MKLNYHQVVLQHVFYSTFKIRNLTPRFIYLA